MIFKKTRGFTLIETVVTLAVVCLLVLMPTLYVKNIKEQMVLDNSTRQVKSTINKYLHLATVKKKSYFLSYFDNNSSIQIKDRKSTRLNSSHVSISYAVFCLKKKQKRDKKKV